MTKKITKRFISFMVTLAMVMAVMPIIPAMADGEQAGIGYALDEIVAPEALEAAPDEEVAIVEEDADDDDYAIATILADAVEYASGRDWNTALGENIDNIDITKDENGIVVTLKENVSLSTYVQPISGSLTVDLAGHKITRTGGTTVFNVTGNGNLIIKGTDGSTVTSEGTTGALVNVQGSNAKIDIQGGTFVLADGNTAGETVLVDQGASFTMSGGELQSKGRTLFVQAGSNASISEGAKISNTGTKAVIVTGDAEDESVKTSFKMSGGTIEAAGTCIQAQYGASVEVTDGTIKKTGKTGSAVALILQSSFTMNNGLIESPTQALNVGSLEGDVSGEQGAGTTATISGTAQIKRTEGAESTSTPLLQVKGGQLNIESDATINDTVSAFANGELNVKGGTITSPGFAIGTNGSKANNPNNSIGAKINITGGKISGDITGVYLPAGEMNVSGEGENAPTITGKAGIVVRGGELNVQGGTIVATGGAGETVTVGDATAEGGEKYTVPAAGITVDNAGYPAQEGEDGQKHVSIGKGATVKAPAGGETLAACENGTPVSATEPGNKVKPEENPFNISGGTFTTGDGATSDSANVTKFLGDGYEYNTGGTIEYTGENPEAEINGRKFATLKDALDYAQTGDTITILEAITISDTDPITITKNITIDLAGKTITASNEAVFNVVGGNLTIKDSGESEGAVISTAEKLTAIRVKEGGKLTVDGATVKSESGESVIQINPGNDETHSTVEIKKDSKITGGRVGISVFAYGELIVSGGDIYGTGIGIASNGTQGGATDGQKANIKITDGKITGGVVGMYLPSPNGETTISGGEISGQAGVVQFGGKLTVEDGTITATGEANVTVGDSTQSVPPAAVATNKSDTGSYGEPNTTIKGGKFEAAAGKDAVTYTKNGGEAEDGSALTVEGGSYSSEVDEKLLSDKVGYKVTAGGEEPGTTSYFTTFKDAEEEATANGGTVELVGKPDDVKSRTAVILKGDSIDNVEMKNEDGEDIVEVTVNVGNISAAPAGSAAGDAQPGDAAFWAGVGLVAPEGAETVKFMRSDSEDFVDNTPAGLDDLGGGKRGFAAWVNVGGVTGDKKTATETYTLKWLKNDGTEVDTVTYRLVFTEVTLTGDPAPFIDEVGFNADAADAEGALKQALGKPSLTNKIVPNTMYMVFHLQGPVGAEGTDVKAEFVNGSTKYIETFKNVPDNNNHAIFFSFDDADDNNADTASQGAKFGEGTYNVKITAGDTFYTTAKIDIYKIEFKDGGTESQIVYVAAKSADEAKTAADEMVKTMKPKNYGGKVFTGWGTAAETDHAVTYTAQFKDYEPVVARANIADNGGETGIVDGDYKVEKGDNTADGKYTITGTATNLKKHKNENDEEAYWFGVEIEAPEDVAPNAQYTVTFGDSDKREPVALETLYNTTNHETKKGAVLYFKTEGDGDDKREVTIEWDENHTYTYVIDLSAVEHYVGDAAFVDGGVGFLRDRNNDFLSGLAAKIEAGQSFNITDCADNTLYAVFKVDPANSPAADYEVTFTKGEKSYTETVSDVGKGGIAYVSFDDQAKTAFGDNPQGTYTVTVKKDGAAAASASTGTINVYKVVYNVTGGTFTGGTDTTKDGGYVASEADAEELTKPEVTPAAGNTAAKWTKSVNDNVITYTATCAEYVPEVAEAKIADKEGDVANVVGDYSAKYTTKDTDGYHIEGKAADLKQHTNGDGNEGYWFGVEIKAPDGVDLSGTYKLTVDGTAVADPQSFEKLVNIADATGAILYFNTTGEAGDKHTVTIEWDENTEFTYVIDLSAVEHYAEPTYTVTIGTMTGGQVTADTTAAVKDETVTLTVAADQGYKLDSVSVNEDPAGTEVETTPQEDGTYTFTMPASNVTVTATFTADEPDTAEIKYVGFITKDENGNEILNALAPQVKGDGETWGTEGITDCIANTLYAAFSAANEEGADYTVKFTKGEKSYEQTVEGVTKGGLAYVSFDDQAKTAFGDNPQGEYTVELYKNGEPLNASSDNKIKVYQVKYVAGTGVTGTDTVVYTDAEGLNAAQTAHPEGFTLASGMNRWNDNKAETSGYDVTVTLSGYHKSTGGGGSSSGGTTKHTVSTPSKSDNGSVSVSSKNASKGSKVTITVKPDKGYMTGSVVVKDANGNEIEVIDNGDGTYSFIMPDTKVSIEPEFVPEGTATPAPEATPSPEPTPAPDAEDNCPSEKFVDVDQSLWYHESIDYALTNGLMSGIDATTFEPNSTTTRAMIVSVLYRLDGSPEAAEANFTDVPDGAWYADAVAWGEANGVVSGYDEETFGPEDYITREQMASILYRYAQYKGIDVSAQADLSGYYDAALVSDWANTSLSWANAAGIVSGVSDTELAPTETATRAQVASILMRFCENIVK